MDSCFFSAVFPAVFPFTLADTTFRQSQQQQQPRMPKNWSRKKQRERKKPKPKPSELEDFFLCCFFLVSEFDTRAHDSSIVVFSLSLSFSLKQIRRMNGTELRWMCHVDVVVDDANSVTQSSRYNNNNRHYLMRIFFRIRDSSSIDGSQYFACLGSRIDFENLVHSFIHTASYSSSLDSRTFTYVNIVDHYHTHTHILHVLVEEFPE